MLMGPILSGDGKKKVNDEMIDLNQMEAEAGSAVSEKGVLEMLYHRLWLLCININSLFRFVLFFLLWTASFLIFKLVL